MKYLVLLLVLFLYHWGNAQNLFILEDKVPTEDREVTAFIIRTTDDFNEAITNYKAFVKDKYDLKVKKVNNTTYMIEAVDLPHLSVKRGDLKTYLFHTDSMNILAFSFLLGYDISINSEEYPEEMIEFKKLVLQYMEFHYTTYFTDKIDQQNKALDKVKKDLKQNENKINSMKKKVISLEKKAQKEVDESKKMQLRSEKASLESDIEGLLTGLTPLREKISDDEKIIFEMKNELNNYNKAISDLQTMNYQDP